MAYKFQVGGFTASGSIKAESGFDAGDSNIANVGDIDADSVSVADAANGLNIDFSAANTGTGVITLRDNMASALDVKEGSNSYLKFVTTDSSELIEAGQSIDLASGKVLSVAGTTIIDADGAEKVKSAVAGNGLGHSAGVLSVQVTGGVNIGNDRVGISGSIAGDGLTFTGAHAGVTTIAIDASPDSFDLTGGSLELATNVAGTGLNLNTGVLSVSGSQTLITSLVNESLTKIGTATNQEYIDFGSLNQIKFGINNVDEMTLAAGGLSITNGLQIGAGESVDVSSGGALLIGDATATSVVLGRSGQEVRVAGDLIVQGTTKSINAATIEITSSFTFEGSTADANETVLNIIDPSADRTVSLPNQSGVVAVFSPNLSDDELATALLAGPSEINLLHSGSAIGSAVSDLADTDGIIVEDGNVMKKIQLSSIKTYIGAGSVSVTSASAGTPNFALQKGVNYYNQQGAAVTAVLLTGSSMTAGDSIKVKAGADCSSTNTVTISTLGSDTIEGTEDHIVLESPNAAVEFIYVAQGDYRIF